VAGIAVPIPLEVVLMLGLGFPERPRGRHLGHDLPRPATRAVDVGDRLLGDPPSLSFRVEHGEPAVRRLQPHTEFDLELSYTPSVLEHLLVQPALPVALMRVLLADRH
jgi:hypothetical protein